MKDTGEQSQMLCEDFLMSKLHGGLWHTTHPQWFLKILDTGAILPEPDINNEVRWEAERGPEFYPYVRSIGGVSLFDFQQFDPRTYADDFPFCDWRKFVPCLSTRWGGAAWIEIDRAQMQASEDFICGGCLRIRWNLERAYRHVFMPQIEAAHIGPLSTTAFKKIIFVFSKAGPFHELDWSKFDRTEYEKLLEAWKASRRIR
jgi:hypothetical protein